MTSDRTPRASLVLFYPLPITYYPMTQHDTWVYLKEGSPIDSIKHLFPKGIPMRDPFPMELGDAGSEKIPLWLTDLERMNPDECLAFAEAIAAKFNVNPGQVMDEAIANEGFGIRHELIESMHCGPEGMQRTKELADFLATAPQPLTPEAWEEFVADQQRRWIDGNEQPPPLPTSIEEVDPRLVTPELIAAIQQRQIESALSNYSVLDVLTGKAMVDILNQLDPESEYSVVGWDDEEEEEY